MKKTEIIINQDSFPAALRPYWNQARLYDSSCSEAAQTIYIDGPQRAFLKISRQGTLSREMKMMSFMHSHNLAPAVLDYISEQGRDYLLSAALEGEDGIAERYLQHPVKLAEVFGASLRIIHSLPILDCPFPSRLAEMLAQSERNILRGYADKAIIKEDIKAAAERLMALKDSGLADVIIHGDYCLPNIIMQDFCLTGFIDLGTGGVGDRHYDLFWGIWTLQYNLKTAIYKDAFLDAYGRQDLDPDRLELCRLLSGFTQ
ncbi:MAG: aminoglycoside 3'-phosphotransferase [Candidatus Cloacimonetes bacterium]|nr:aminoglycoside 3'-phosphotransferase [Candidatus Cloacimonadota bacterium]MDY0172128.1 aminoglycoside 3'-phosphotransferase [Candidatus Cloacimonadaceae bacterium]